MMAELRNDRHQTDLGRMAAWANGDEDGAPSNGKGTEPVKYPGDNSRRSLERCASVALSSVRGRSGKRLGVAPQLAQLIERVRLGFRRYRYGLAPVLLYARGRQDAPPRAT